MLWKSSLETGIPQIDAQHKELFRQIDILMDRSNANYLPFGTALKANKSLSVLSGIIQRSKPDILPSPACL